ncbi:ATP synthase F1 subunit epsilon [bacterium (Candidatus Gribaldobacteria) CG_4_10_14_0_2_um_filter_41_16]|uniref:ATP synthase epsilon chain n=4 Tax=Candidatus Gribaldobacteria TaxID=2798536 RepID=A0A2M7VHW5_9BACT|nr:MAG: ATP synthase F1 subunit epsilon [Parcubacteria group bacterium CG1_02_41_26]PIR91796.1 MAG: ATP synthase F1 subunit epsilon [bacterium (Candidatus Gribaldobacteria) CG10_big_fil_rev_8_21_14_0_10_41_12]PIV46860.1 MAG: ATP synthase F1 subunit epsilon [bacterium (Candidatus Gribaldobacteria) CG02_land_8_20_14_3_00_41_15]PIX03340.1 MAG: ATP synthase F1 subunit epsilon [bacterium (Candidatus Gribaldobacteria) CG_4_8_14_3_um_filter_42_11]PJA01434.1 MAG: ATP synthase F1 subunit epsilon [bacter
MNKINFKIVTPERVVYESEIDQATIPTVQGEITILPNHISLVGVLKPGELMIKKGKEEIAMAVSGGMIEVAKNKVIVLADTAEHASEIDEQRAKEAKDRALKLMSEKNREEVDYTGLAIQIEKELARLKVARRHKGSPPFQMTS